MHTLEKNFEAFYSSCIMTNVVCRSSFRSPSLVFVTISDLPANGCKTRCAQNTTKQQNYEPKTLCICHCNVQDQIAYFKDIPSILNGGKYLIS